MNRQLWKFHGGLELPEHKSLSTKEPVQPLPVPAQLVLPLQQHIGAAAKPVVEVGQRVLKGEMVAKADGYVSAPVHASASGTVVAIEERPVPHPSGLSAPCIVIETDGKEIWAERHPVQDFKALDPSALRNLIREAGIVGLGGAGFPAYVKLNPGARTAVDTLILNGAECEPYITCDDMLMRERADEVIAGACIMRHALQARECLIGIEDNKPQAIAALKRALERRGGAAQEIQVVTLPTRYPTGGEKQLIYVLTGKEVPSQGLPLDIGVVCHNVATAASVHRAVEGSEPLISRIVTVTGAVARPGNFEAAIGTPIAALLKAAGGTTGETAELIMGGPMMGFALERQDIPLVKTGNCILALPRDSEYANRAPVRPCIRCGACAEVCPVRLLPQQIYWHARAKDLDKAQDYGLFDCIECGCCAYVCPSNLPLVQYYRFAKNEVWAQEREKLTADRARERHEFRQERQEREKAERAARMQKKKADLGDSGKASAGDAAKKAAIEAAMERAKAKKAGAGTQPKNIAGLTDEQEKKIADVESRRAAEAAEKQPSAAAEVEKKE